jgi:hypothetical protein
MATRPPNEPIPTPEPDVIWPPAPSEEPSQDVPSNVPEPAPDIVPFPDPSTIYPTGPQEIPFPLGTARVAHVIAPDGIL